MVTSTLLGHFLIGERLDSVQYGCMAFIAAGFLAVVWVKNRDESEATFLGSRVEVKEPEDRCLIDSGRSRDLFINS